MLPHSGWPAARRQVCLPTGSLSRPLVVSGSVVSIESPGRRSLLDGASNFRDLGGYSTVDERVVRMGRLFRSGALHALTDADLERLRALGVRVAVDLRPPEEQLAEPTNAPFLRIVHVPLMRGERTGDPSALANGDGYLRDRYAEIVLDRASEIGTIFRSLALEDGLPAVIHCAAGKDRTGVVSAIILLALGVDEPTVLDDYELTSVYAAAARVEELTAKLSASGLPPAVVAGLLGTSRSALSDAIAGLREEYGTVEDYLVGAAGVAPADLVTLRERLTGPST
jgi:protein-tyrosine phosphatase